MDPEKNRQRVLLLGDDMRIFLALARSLGRSGREVHAAPFDWRAPALRSRYVARTHRLRRYTEGPEEWVRGLRELAGTFAFDLIIPCCDRAILPLSFHRDAFPDLPIALPAPDLMDLLFDKERTRALAAELGIPVARGERLAAGQTAGALIARFGLPLVVKPRRSFSMDRLDSAGRVHIVETEAELTELLSRLAQPSDHLVEAFFAHGEGVGVSVLADDGEIRLAFQHRRLREGWGGSSSYRISEPLDARLLQACAAMCGRLRLAGVCMFEFRRSTADGSFILIETNARFWGSCSLPISLGVDFPTALFELLVQGKAPAPSAYETGVRSRNFVIDAANILRALRTPHGLSLAERIGAVAGFLLQPLAWLTGAERSDSFAADDLRPALLELGQLPQALGSRRRPSDLDRRRAGAGEDARPAAVQLGR